MQSFTAYDASVLGLVLRHNKDIDCSELLGNLSPLARKIAENMIDISNSRTLRYPGAKMDTIGLIRYQEGCTKKFRQIVAKYYPEYWDHVKQEKLKKKKAKADAREKQRQRKAEKLLQKERAKNPLLAKTLDELERLRMSSGSSNCDCNHGRCTCNDWDDGRPCHHPR